VPTKALMRTHSPWWARSRGSARRHAGKRKDLDVLPAKVGSSICGEVLAQPHSPNIHPPDRSEQDRLARNLHRCGWRQETTDRTHATGSIPFGRLLPDTALAKNRADNPSDRKGETAGFSKSILLTHFARSSGWPRLGSAASRLLATRASSAQISPVARPNAAAHCHGPYASGTSSTAANTGGDSFGGAHSISRSCTSCIL
jgi:hypothetical protein